MRVRYRKLSRSFDAKAFSDVIDDAVKTRNEEAERWNATVGPVMGALDARPADSGAGLDTQLTAAAVGLISAPDKVSVVEAEAELEDVRALLQRGELNANDLVNLGNGWTTIGDCVPLSDDAEPDPGADSTRAVTIIVLFLVGTMILAPLIYFLGKALE